MNEYNLLIGLITFIVGFAIAFWVKGLIVSQKVKAAEKETSRILKDAKFILRKIKIHQVEFQYYSIFWLI